MSDTTPSDTYTPTTVNSTSSWEASVATLIFNVSFLIGVGVGLVGCAVVVAVICMVAKACHKTRRRPHNGTYPLQTPTEIVVITAEQRRHSVATSTSQTSIGDGLSRSNDYQPMGVVGDTLQSAVPLPSTRYSSRNESKYMVPNPYESLDETAPYPKLPTPCGRPGTRCTYVNVRDIRGTAYYVNVDDLPVKSKIKDPETPPEDRTEVSDPAEAIYVNSGTSVQHVWPDQTSRNPEIEQKSVENLDSLHKRISVCTSLDSEDNYHNSEFYKELYNILSNFKIPLYESRMDNGSPSMVETSCESNTGPIRNGKRDDNQNTEPIRNGKRDDKPNDEPKSNDKRDGESSTDSNINDKREDKPSNELNSNDKREDKPSNELNSNDKREDKPSNDLNSNDKREDKPRNESNSPIDKRDDEPSAEPTSTDERDGESNTEPNSCAKHGGEPYNEATNNGRSDGDHNTELNITDKRDDRLKVHSALFRVFPKTNVE